MSLSAGFRRGQVQLLKHAGCSVTLRKQTITYDSNNDVVRVNSDSTITAIVHLVRLEDVQENANLEVGDAFFYVSYDCNVAEKDIIIQNGVSYVIEKIVPETAEGNNIIFKECYGKKYTYT